MMNHTRLIKKLIKENGYRSYLEIGIGNCANFLDINIDRKLGVDPNVHSLTINDKNIRIYQMTSDDYFLNWYTDISSNRFDIIFIDGLHHADQVERDIINAWHCLNVGGAILIHDISPSCKEETVIPRGGQKVWTGDVYKAWAGFKTKYPHLRTNGYKFDHGIGVIYKDDPHDPPAEGFCLHDLSYEQFDLLRHIYFDE